MSPSIALDRFQTDRLRAERITPAHLEEISSLYRDPEVMKTLSADGNILSDDAIRQLLAEAVKHWEEYGFGFWVFRDRLDGQFVGRGGLKLYRIDDRDVIGLAYAVASRRWRRGYATEMAEATLRIGFEHLGFPGIASWTRSP